MLSDAELQWMNNNYPDLYYDQGKDIIIGELSFKVYYSDDDNKFVINPDDSYKNIIGDVYEIEIDFSQKKLLPSVKETGGKIEKIKVKLGLPNIGELHVNPKGTLCLCVKTEEQIKMPKGFNLSDFFNNLLIPFFYYQSYYEKYGKEPWKGFSHGELGVLEHYEVYKGDISKDTIEIFLKNISPKTLDLLIKNERLQGHHKCICCSGKIFRDCHYRSIFGYNKLRNDYNRFHKK